MDQNYIQRYHTASSAKEAGKSVWLCVWIYLPASLLFFIIGSCLYAFYQENPSLIEPVKIQVALERLGESASQEDVNALATSLQPADYGDKVMPYFMVTKMPTGLIGLVVSAILSAAMSTISSGMNASATVFSVDIYQRYIKREQDDKQMLRLLHLATIVFGLLGMIAGVMMIGVKSILDIWWQLSGIFAGGMLGLFLLGLLSRKAGNTAAIAATVVGILTILWMSLSYLIPPSLAYLKSSLHANMIIVVGTLTIYLVGTFIGTIQRKV